MKIDDDGISNLDFPVSKAIRSALHKLSFAKQIAILNGLSTDEFISLRVDTYLIEIENAMHAGFDEGGAKEIALKECLTELHDNHGEVFED